MINGVVRLGLPRVVLPIPTLYDELRVEFIVDTGYDGHLVLPPDIVRRMDTGSLDRAHGEMADGTVGIYPAFEIVVDWFDETRALEVLIMNGRPLLGATAISSCHLSADMEEGGDVVIEFPS